MRLEEEIKQQKFESEYHKAHINILFSASWLNQKVTTSLKPYKISRQQFNLLRILKGQYPNPSTIKLLSERMIDKMSNASRIVDKLERRELVIRSESKADRRSVDIVLTDKGLRVLEKCSEVIMNGIQEWFEKLSTDEAKILSNILDKMRLD